MDRAQAARESAGEGQDGKTLFIVRRTPRYLYAIMRILLTWNADEHRGMRG